MKKNKIVLHIVRFIVCIVLFFNISPALGFFNRIEFVGTDLASMVTNLVVLAPISIMGFKDFFAIFDDVFQLITDRKDKKEEQSKDEESK